MALLTFAINLATHLLADGQYHQFQTTMVYADSVFLMTAVLLTE
jgi:hypothetical protein